MDEDELWDDIYRQLASATKSGVHVAKSTRRGLTLTAYHRPFTLPITSLEQIVQTISSIDISSYVTGLLQTRLARLNVDPAALFKLRTTLILGVGSARYVDPDGRRTALARTYRNAVPMIRATSTEPNGVEQYRDRYGQLRRAERDQLLREVAFVVRDHIREIELSDPKDESLKVVSESESVDRNYQIVSVVDQHVFPDSPSGRIVVYKNRQIRALRDGVSQFRQQYSLFTGSGSRPNPTIVGVGNMKVDNLRREVQNSLSGYRYDLVIDFLPLAKDETYLLTWLVEYEAAPGDLGSGHGVYTIDLIPRDEIEIAEISAHFHPALEPSQIWRLDDVIAGDARLPEAASAPITLVDGYVRGQWPHPRLGRASGIAWRW